MSTMKLNFDGAVRDGLVQVGGVLRNTRGEVLLAHSGNSGQGTNNVAEATALLWDLKFVVDMRFRKLSIEGDSRIIIDFVPGWAQLGWAIQSILGDIWQFLKALDHYDLQHTYKEGNAVADAMVGLGFDLGSLKS